MEADEQSTSLLVLPQSTVSESGLESMGRIEATSNASATAVAEAKMTDDLFIFVTAEYPSSVNN